MLVLAITAPKVQFLPLKNRTHNTTSFRRLYVYVVGEVMYVLGMAPPTRGSWMVSWLSSRRWWHSLFLLFNPTKIFISNMCKVQLPSCFQFTFRQCPSASKLRVLRTEEAAPYAYMCMCVIFLKTFNMVQEDCSLLGAQTLYKALGKPDTLCILSSVVSLEIFWGTYYHPLILQVRKFKCRKHIGLT